MCIGMLPTLIINKEERKKEQNHVKCIVSSGELELEKVIIGSIFGV